MTGIVDRDSGIQIIIGTHVGDVYKEFIKLWKSDDEAVPDDSENTHFNDNKKGNWFNEFVALVVSIFLLYFHY